jgi:hypothetical protein
MARQSKPQTAFPQHGVTSRDRRLWLARAAAMAVAAAAGYRPARAHAQGAVTLRSSGPLARRALVIGNSTYAPAQQSIPSSRKNALDVAAALTQIGFDVRQEVDQGAGAMREQVRDFFGSLRSQSAPPAIGLFYYTGHGIQFNGENYMVPTDVSVTQAAEGIARASVNIDKEVIAHATLPNDGTCVLIFDACRNDPSKGPTDRGGSFNQVNPPRGTVITFSTAPGRYAIAPRSPDENSIYTKILVQELRKANAAITVKDFLDAVKFEVRRFMESSDEAFLRKHAQDPEVAANLPLRITLALEQAPVQVPDAEQQAWARIDQAIEPGQRIKLLKEFLDTHKESRFAQAAAVQLQRAEVSDVATQRTRVQAETNIGDAEFRADQAKALDGDKDAAYRVGQMFANGTNGVPRDERRMVQWMRHAAELKNGIAAYQLSLHYRNRGLDREAVRYENLAREHGYTPPPRLDTRRG